MLRRLLALALIAGLTFAPFISLATEAQEEYLGTVAKLFNQFGEYPDWSLENKLEWLAAYKRYLGDDLIAQQVDELLHSNNDDRERIIDEYLLSKYYAAKHAQYLNIHYCLIGELGPQHAWSLQQQAWVSQLYLKNYPEQWET